MSLLNITIRGYFSIRDERLVALYENQLQTQANWFYYMLKNGAKTAFGKEFGLDDKLRYEQFAEQVPIQDYTTLHPYIQRIIAGERNVLWSTKINWLAKSSGTTSAKSKFLPVSDESMKLNNYLAAQDVLTFYCNLFPETELFTGKGITLGGSRQALGEKTALQCGDISAVLMENMPVLGEMLKAPAKEILLEPDWNKKLPLIATHTAKENITSLSGVPSWMLLVMKELLYITGKQYVHEVWPNLELYMHGGVAFAPYKEEYKQLFAKGDVFFMNMYNASEGFFGFQDQHHSDDLLLLTDHAVFYEFIELAESNSDNKKAIPLSDVELGKNYAVVITTAAGLWRYKIGDVICFTSLNPYRFKIVGRTTQYINVFGEELIVDNADKALAATCQATQAIVAEYTAAPVYLNCETKTACHEWIIEFTKQPANIDHFTEILDQELKKVNSDYEAKRSSNLMLQSPCLHVAPQGTFLKWLALHNKLGGQYKVPRLQNERQLLEEILQLMD
ncbi:MAG: GH3 auxin-responsive promoter family protein [Bacteroidales bacterium]|jgi:hypothetical protein|nr:GH3 auxin-responsive promoter family protein [Bacteroidales bacterium]